MSRRVTAIKRRLSVETLEERALLSAAAVEVPGGARHALIGHVSAQDIKTDPAGAAAILSALNGGMGSEFVALIRKNVPKPSSVIKRFVLGQTSQFSIPGFAVATPGFQPQFTSGHFDQLAPTSSGALLLRGNTLELGAIMRGPFRDPNTAYYVFALNRGAGAGLGPTFPSVPGITPDALVTIAVGPMGSSPTGTIQDLTDGSSQTIDPSNIEIKGSTLRVFLNTDQVPSKGLPIQKYRYTFWTQTALGGDISTVGNFLPPSMIGIGVLKNTAPTR